MSRPSDDNQRHSNKVEPIEVVLTMSTRDDLLGPQKPQGSGGELAAQGVSPEQQALNQVNFQSKMDE